MCIKIVFLCRTWSNSVLETLKHKQACRFHTDPLVDCDSFATICVELAYIVPLPKMFFSSGQIIPPISFSPTGPKQHDCCGTKSETNGWMKNHKVHKVSQLVLIDVHRIDNVFIVKGFYSLWFGVSHCKKPSTFMAVRSLGAIWMLTHFINT